MRGSVQADTKRGTWTVVVDNGTDPATGKRRQVRRRGFTTEGAAERYLGEVLSTAQRGRHVEPSKQTVRAFLDDWLASLPPTATSKWYGTLVRAYVVPNIGAMPLRAVDAGTLDGLYAHLRVAGAARPGPDGEPRGLSERSVRAVHIAMRKAFGKAVAWGRIADNPAVLAEAPKQTPSTATAWNAEELRTFLDHAQHDRLIGLWHLAGMTGMRRGELLALRWSDVDLDAATVAVVRAAVVGVDAQVIEGPTKTRRGRSVALDPHTVKVLRAHRTRQLEERLHAGVAWTDTGLVFTREDGTAIHPSYATSVFSRLVRASGLPSITLHGLRHTHATVALKAGIHPKVVQERLGHASIRITLDLYSHVAPGMQEEAAAKIAAMVAGKFL